MIVSNKQSIISLLWKSACGFSKFSKRQTTPKILRDHRFTRKGMVMGKESKDYKYDLTNLPASQAHQEHLFFNKSEDLKLLKQQADDKEKNLKNQHIFEDHSIVETLLLEIQDKFLIQNHPSKILNNIMVIDKEFKNEGEIKELVQIALQRLISEQVRSFTLRDFGILVTLSRTYLSSNVKIWETLANNYCRLLSNNEYHDRKILDVNRSKKQIDNAVMTLTSVLKFANQFNLKSCIDNLADAATSYLSSNIDVVEDVNHRFLLVANVLPIIPSDVQAKLIEFIKQKPYLITQLKANTLTALTHSLYKVKQQNVNNTKFPVNTLIDTPFLQKIEQTWLKNFDKKNASLLSIYSYSLASMGYNGETKAYTQNFLETNIKDITDLKNLSFLGEALKKFQCLSQKYFDAANFNLKLALNSDKNQITPELALQFLRISSKKLFLNSEIAASLIKIIDQAYYYEQYQPRASQTEMIVKTLQKYSQIVDLSNLKIYQTLIGSKKIL